MELTYAMSTMAAVLVTTRSEEGLHVVAVFDM
jgi:hypothetical protein